MFSSSGFFRGIGCPYFSSGLCERPYCHFRHVKSDDPESQTAKDAHHRFTYGEELDAAAAGGATSPIDVSLIKPSMLSMMGHAIKQVQEFDRLKSQAPQYKPTPIAGRRPAGAHRKYAVPHAPEYKPTPICVLKKAPAAIPDAEFDPLLDSSVEDPALHLSKTSQVTLTGTGRESASKRQHGFEPPAVSDSIKLRKLSETKANFGNGEQEEAKFLAECEAVTATSAGSVDSVSSSHLEESQADSSQTNFNKGRMNIFEKLNRSKSYGEDFALDTGKETGKACPLAKSCNREKTVESEQQTLDEGRKDSEPGRDSEKENKSRSGERPDTDQREVQRSSSKHSKHSSSERKRSTHKDSNKLKDSESSARTKEGRKSSQSERRKSRSEKDQRTHSAYDKHKKSHSSHERHKQKHSSHSKHGKHKKHKSHDKASEKTPSARSKTKHAQHHSRHSSGERSSGCKSKSCDSRSRSPGSCSSGHSSSKHHEQLQSKNDKKASLAPERIQRALSLTHSDLFGEDSDTDAQGGTSRDSPGNVLKSLNVEDDAASSSSSDTDSDILLSTGIDTLVSDDDAYDECLRLYTEEDRKCKEAKEAAQHKGKPTKPQLNSNGDNDDGTLVIIGKKRTAHAGAEEGAARRKMLPKPNSRPTPAQVMQSRLISMQHQAQEQRQGAVSSGSTAASSGNRMRIAHVPGAGVGQTKNSPLSRQLSTSFASRLHTSHPAGTEARKTVCGTVGKTGTRIAHIPKQASLKRPTVVPDAGSKVPTNVRQRYLNLLIDECIKIYPEKQDAYDRAVAEEKGVYGRSSNRNIYLNIAIKTVRKLRDEKLQQSAATASGQKQSGSKSSKALSHQALLDGSRATATSFTVRRSGGPCKTPENIKGANLYQVLQKYILTEEQLVENGFPRPSTDNSGSAVIKLKEEKKPTKLKANSHDRVCCRCGARFEVFPNGKYVKQEDCMYHWGKCWKRRVAGAVESRYTCCQGDLGSKGCEIAKYHVHEENKISSFSTGFVKTIPCSPPPDGDYDVYSLDCEMVYTTHGVELARITVIDPDLKPVFEKLVKPEHKILDCNTRFSGLTEQDFNGVQSTLRDVQAVLLSLFTQQTILIGHSLESDLLSLKLIHDKVVDTSVVFPHRLGPPYKRALRTLMGEILQKIIQNDVGGHDSKEDAMACMELMLWKVKDDARKAGRRS